MDRILVGEREFARATDGRGPVATGRVAEASPVLAQGVQEFIFADVFSRSALPARERELVTVAVLAAIGGAEPQLGVHIPAALQCGVDPDELVALCEQLAPYVGFPRALNALRAVRAALEEHGRPASPVAQRVSLGDHTTLSALVGEGEGPVVVLVHPLGLDHRVWRPVLAALPEGTRALVYDLRGHGEAAGAPTVGFASLIDDLTVLLDHHGVSGPVRLAAAGTAASVGTHLASALGERLEELLLLGPVSPAPAAGDHSVLVGWLQPLTLSADGVHVRYLRDRIARADPDLWQQLVGPLAPPAGHALRLLVGEHDPWRGESERGATSLGVSATVIEGAGNLLPIEAPAAVAAHLAAMAG